MLTKKNSLSKKTDIQRVFKKGKIYFSPFFNLKILSNNYSYLRVCIIISTKISKKAVLRNKIKRQLKVIISKKVNQIEGGYDLIILTKPAALAINFQQLNEYIDRLFKKAKLFK